MPAGGVVGALINRPPRRAIRARKRRQPTTPIRRAKRITNYKRADESEALSRQEIIEQEALAFHESDGHPDRFGTCTLGCWEAAEVAVDDALHAGELVAAADPEP
jgi:hypothetical protein